MFIYEFWIFKLLQIGARTGSIWRMVQDLRVGSFGFGFGLQTKLIGSILYFWNNYKTIVVILKKKIKWQWRTLAGRLTCTAQQLLEPLVASTRRGASQRMSAQPTTYVVCCECTTCPLRFVLQDFCFLSLSADISSIWTSILNQFVVLKSSRRAFRA